MSAQQFLDNAIGKVAEVLFDAEPKKPSSRPNPYSAKPNKGNFSGQSRNVFDTIKDKIKSMPGSQPARPNPYAAKPTGQLTQKNAGSLVGLGNMSVGGAVAAPLILGGSEDSGIKWRRLGYPSKAAYDTAVRKNAHKNQPLETEKTDNTSEINKRLDQQKAERAAALAITKGDYDHSSGNFGLVPDSTNDASESGRDDTRISPTGLPQTGTSMSKSFNQLLETTNTSGYQPFGGKQLPTTTGHPDSKIGPVTNGVVYSDMLQNAPGFGTVGVGPLANGEAYARAVEGNAKTPRRLDTALSDTAGINSYMSKFSSGDRERAANRAFLDTEKSMEALRAKEAVNGVVFAQNRHYISGKSGDDQAIGIDRSQARDISSGRSSAQSLLEAHIAKNKDVSEDTPASAQNPLSEAGEAIKSAFSAGAQTDFALNNNKVGPRTGVGPVVDPDIIENYDFTKPGAEEAYFKKLNSGGFFR